MRIRGGSEMFAAVGAPEGELIQFAPTYMEPVYIGEAPGTSDRARCAMGTATLLKLGRRRLAITCAHVIDELTSRRGSGQASFFQLGALVFDPSPDVRDYSSTLDLVVIDVTERVLDRESKGEPGAGEASFHAPEHWPPDELSEGAVISFAGFPGAWREQSDVARFELYVMSHGATQVEVVGDNYFWTKIEPDKCVGWSAEGKDLQEIAGLSGGPVFGHFRRSDGRLAAELVGFVQQYNRDLDLLYVRSSSVIRPNGRLID